MPLPDHSKLQVQVLDTIRNRVIQMIKDAGYEPICRGVLPRIHATGWLAASIYEVDFPKPQIPVQDDRIRGEIATREKPSWEIEQLRRYLGIGPKK
jgi:hypothetical protein